MASEKEIIKGCIEGKKKYHKLLFDQYAPILLPVCLRYGNDRQGAEDILQDSFIKIFEKLQNYRGEGTLEGWMKRIVVNTALNHIRAKANYQYHKDVHDLSDQLPGNEDFRDDLYAKDILNIIQKLPPGYRMVFNLYEIEGYSHKEISEKLGITENTSKTQLMKCRRLLRKWFSEY
ncbi:MAG: RNA polymerase sigma factor [Bacteroidales bacterium]